MDWWLLLIPVSSAFSCWLVIRLFFFFLFRRVLPKKRSLLAAKIGKAAAENFFSEEIMEEKIADPKNLQKIMPVVEEHIDDFLRNKLKKQMPVVGMFIGDKTINSMKAVFMSELENLFPQVMKNFASNLKDDLGIEKLVAEKINSVPAPVLEKAFYNNLSGEIRLLSISCASIGFLIGCITAVIILFIN
jgi:uncharacterized membrane protein YheB (UPF0754 family)